MLAIAGGKGGCGKTTTTLGVAAALDGEVLVVDADRDMPNLHALAGVPRETTVADVSGDPLSTAHESSCELSVLPAAPSGPDGDTATQLPRVKSMDTTTLVDCPVGAGPDAAGPLRVADAAVLVTTLCAPALRDTAKTAAMRARSERAWSASSSTGRALPQRASRSYSTAPSSRRCRNARIRRRSAVRRTADERRTPARPARSLVSKTYYDSCQ